METRVHYRRIQAASSRTTRSMPDRCFARHIDEETLETLPPVKRFRPGGCGSASWRSRSSCHRPAACCSGSRCVTALNGLVLADGTLWLLGGFVLVDLLDAARGGLTGVRSRTTSWWPATFSWRCCHSTRTPRPASMPRAARELGNTVDRDFYDIQPLADGRLLVELGRRWPARASWPPCSGRWGASTIATHGSRARTCRQSTVSSRA